MQLNMGNQCFDLINQLTFAYQRIRLISSHFVGIFRVHCGKLHVVQFMFILTNKSGSHTICLCRATAKSGSTLQCSGKSYIYVMNT